MSGPDCPFCDRILTDQVDNTWRGPEGWTAVSFEPLNPVTPGHLLFVPSLHLARATHHRGSATAAWSAAMQWADMQSENYNLILSQGAASTQTIEHMHLHYVPRREGDGLHLPWTDQEKR